jgi:hypothetical protein
MAARKRFLFVAFFVPSLGMSGSKEVSLEEIKALAFTTIQREIEGAPVLPLKDWMGFSSHVSGGMYASVTYYLEGNRVRVHKALEDGDHYYILK